MIVSFAPTTRSAWTAKCVTDCGLKLEFKNVHQKKTGMRLKMCFFFFLLSRSGGLRC